MNNQKRNKDSPGLLGRMTRAVKVIAANPEIIKVSSGGSVFPFLIWYVIVFVGSVVVVVPVTPAILVGALAELLIHYPNEVQPGVAYWLGFGITHAIFAGVSTILLMVNLLNADECQQIRLAKLTGSPASFTPQQRLLDQWLHAREKAIKRKDSPGVLGRMTRVMKVIAANPEIIKVSSGGSVFLFLFWYVIVFVGSVVVVVPVTPAILVGALVGVLNDPNQTEAGVAFWLGTGITHALFAGPYTILFKVSFLNADKCQQIRLAKLRGSPASFTQQQRLLDQWLHAREKAIKRDEKIAAEKARLEAAAAKDLEMEAARSRGLSWDEDDESDSTSPLPAPRDAEHFEEVCAIFLRRLGHETVSRTPTGPDGGIDVISNEAVGQAKFHPSQKVSAEPIRALAGSRLEHGKQEAYFFHYGPGYTDDAINVGHRLGVKLYEFDAQRRVFRRRA